jgi:iron complex transport system substrate-binding protein
MRICSLLPSATEILYSLGLGEQIVAVTHECDFPPAAATKPKVTANVIDHDRLTSAEIDHHVASNIGRHGSIYTLDDDLLRQLQPDLIVTQELCDVCAVSYKQVERAARVLEGATKIISLEPNTLDDVLATILLIGNMTGRADVAHENVQHLRRRLDRVRQRVAALARPTVYAMEWLDPPFSAGHWVPEMVALAGGREVLGTLGAKSERISLERIREVSPDIIVLMPCGFSLERTIEEYRRTEFFRSWSGTVFAVNGSAFFNRSGPRLVDGVEILAEIFHPDSNRSSNESNRNFKRLS